MEGRVYPTRNAQVFHASLCRQSHWCQLGGSHCTYTAAAHNLTSMWVQVHIPIKLGAVAVSVRLLHPGCRQWDCLHRDCWNNCSFSSQNGHKCLQTTGIFYLQNKSFYPLDVDIPYCEFYILWQMYLLICFRHWRTYSPVPRRLTNLCKQVSKLNMKAKSHGCSIVYKV